MSLKIIELNDGGIKVGDQSGIAVRSPGFALLSDNDLILGEQAEQQARLQPTKSYNKYWHELSMEPLNHGNHLRHTADIAFAHLMHLAEIGEIDSDVVLAVPGSFSNQQLSILLGLAQQSPINPVGIVDSGVAAAAAIKADSSSLHLDFQLHQIVVTKLVSDSGLVTAESVVQIPGVGSQNFINLMMQQATDSFIEQCRFNPQHNAEYEQLLYNQLPLWLNQYDESQTNLVLELKTSDALHVAKLPKEGLIASLQGHYKRINQELEPLLSRQYSNLIMSPRLASLPGYRDSLPNLGSIQVLKDEAVINACFENVESIVTPSTGLHLVKSLPVSTSKVAAKVSSKSDSNSVPLPTHFVIQNRAVPLRDARIINSHSPSKIDGLENGVTTIQLAAGDLPMSLGEILIKDAGIFIESGELEFYLNSKPVKGLQPLELGDQVKFGAEGEILTAIQVQHGQ